MATLNTLPSSPLINSLFRRAMSPIYLHGWISSWIFENLGVSPFHTDHVIPTQAFSQILLVSCHTRFQHAFFSDVLYRQFEGYLGFVPVHEKDNITVGYAIHVGSDSQNWACSENRLPFAPPYVARVVMDHTTKSLLLVKPCVEFDFIVIHAFNCETRSSHTFLIPFADYSWDHLPDFPPVMTKGIISSKSQSDTDDTIPEFEYLRSDAIQLNHIDLTPKDIQEFMSKLTISPINHTSSTSDATQPFSTSVMRNQNPTSNDFLDDNIPINRSVETLPYLSEQQRLVFKNDILFTLQNRFVTLGKRMDSNDYDIPGYEMFMKLRNIHHVFDIPDFDTYVDASSKYGILYYSAVLSVTTDGPLLLRTSSEQIVTREQVGSTQQSDKSHTCEESVVVEKKDREEILRKRRERNRLSAHRSNARKQEHEKAMRREIELSKPHIRQLKEKQTLLLLQNEQLKSLVNTISNM